MSSDGSDETKKEAVESEKEEEGSYAPAGPQHSANGTDEQPLPGREFIVSWNEPEDQNPENPMNWSSTKKWVNILSISVISFVV